VALLLVLDLGGHADAAQTRHEHEVTGGDADLGAEPRPLAAQGILDHLHQYLLALVQQVLDAAPPRCLAADRVGDHGPGRVAGAGGDVRGMQERAAFEPHLHESRLHPRQHPQDASLVDVADDAVPAGALDEHFLQHAVLHQGDAGLLGGHVDQDLFTHESASALCLP